MTEISLKRVYDPPAAHDGYRILVDRLWPRGLAKSEAKIDLWLKNVAPSNELRKWFDHDPAKWTDFKKRYWAELADHVEMVEEILGHLERGNICLLYASKELRYNNAVALKEYILKRRKK